MKSLVTALLLTASAFAGSAAFAATTDEVKWIAVCVQDNKDEKGATTEITLKYCTCMNNKMDNNETQSITQWEKSHPAEKKACSDEAGWK